MSTAWEQLEGAALSLARSGPIKDRLADAYRNHLALVNPEELPLALRAEFRACHDALTRERPLRGEDAVRATVRKMSNRDADHVARTVVRLFAAMAREAPAQTEHALPEALPEAAVHETLAAGARVNGTHHNGATHEEKEDTVQNGAHHNGANGARPKVRHGVPPVIALCALEA
jgi:hypothetical protein